VISPQVRHSETADGQGCGGESISLREQLQVAASTELPTFFALLLDLLLHDEIDMAEGKPR
jgi:hypothetical protein